MSEHKTKIIVVSLALILIFLALFTQRDVKEAPKASLVVEEDKPITILDTKNFSKSNPKEEFFILRARPADSNILNVSGISIQNKNGQKLAIGNATENFIQASVNKETPIVLADDTSLLVSTGKSPVGVSFKENSCSGFLNQYQTFIPALEESCPSALTIVKKAGIDINPACESFLEKVPNCRIVEDLNNDLDASCINAIKENVHYNGCVAVMKNNTSFSRNSYRIYLDQEKDLFDDRDDIIKIIDQSGKIIGSKLLLNI